jgi:hypothetical protein
VGAAATGRAEKPAKNEKVYAQQPASPPAIQTAAPDVQQHADTKVSVWE